MRGALFRGDLHVMCFTGGSRSLRSSSQRFRLGPRSSAIDWGRPRTYVVATSRVVLASLAGGLRLHVRLARPRGPHGGAPSHRSSAATGEVVRSGATWCDVDRGCRVVSGLVGEGGGRWVGRWGLGCFGFVMLMVLGSCATTFGCQNGSKQDQ